MSQGVGGSMSYFHPWLMQEAPTWAYTECAV